MALPKLIEIFKAGRHTAANGETISFSESDVAKIAANYDPAVHKAPCVVGHPKDNSPAYGHAIGLGLRNGKLLAACTDIDPTFAELVNAKRYPKVSASFYKPDSPSNPKPGAYYLRHIGFLGAMPPAVKGLADASFAGTADDYVSLELAFAEGDTAPADETETQQEAASLDALLKKLEAAGEEIKAKVAEAISKILDTAPAGETADHAERRRALERGERELADRRRSQRRSENETFLTGLRTTGVMLPISQSQALAFMDLLADAPSGSVSFGERERRPADQIFREDLLARIKPSVDFRELSQMPDDEEDANSALNLHERATQYIADKKKQGITVSAAEAVERVMQKSRGR